MEMAKGGAGGGGKNTSSDSADPSNAQAAGSGGVEMDSDLAALRNEKPLDMFKAVLKKYGNPQVRGALIRIVPSTPKTGLSSPCWTVFTRLYEPQADGSTLDLSTVECSGCSKLMFYSTGASTSNMNSHPCKEKRRKDLTKAVEAELNSQSSQSQSSQSQSQLSQSQSSLEQQTSLDDFLAKGKKDRMLVALTRLRIYGGHTLPSSFFDDEMWACLLAVADPSFQQPCKKTREKYEQEEEIKVTAFLVDLMGMHKFSSTLDLVKLGNGSDYLVSTASFIDSTWRLRTICTDVKALVGGHSGENVKAKHREGLLERKFRVENEVSVTTDTTASMKAFGLHADSKKQEEVILALAVHDVQDGQNDLSDEELGVWAEGAAAAGAAAAAAAAGAAAAAAAAGDAAAAAAAAADADADAGPLHSSCLCHIVVLLLGNLLSHSYCVYLVRLVLSLAKTLRESTRLGQVFANKCKAEVDEDNQSSIAFCTLAEPNVTRHWLGLYTTLQRFSKAFSVLASMQLGNMFSGTSFGDHFRIEESLKARADSMVVIMTPFVQLLLFAEKDQSITAPLVPIYVDRCLDSVRNLITS